MAKYDTERFLDDILKIVKSNLNTKIAEIQTEKDALLGDSNFDVPSVADAAYFDSLDDKVANHNPYVYFGVGNRTPIENEDAESSEITAFFLVVLGNDNNPSIYKKSLRYIRALREIISENFGSIPEISNLKVTELEPGDLKDLDGTDEDATFHKIGGIAVQTTIA